MSKPHQYTLPVVYTPDFTPYSYVVGHANEAVYNLITRWPNWPFKQCIVYGAKGYGKTHFGRVLADCQNGKFWEVLDINEERLALISQNDAYVIDRVEACEDFSLLFHFYNIAQAKNCSVVYLMEKPPGKQDFLLPDLNSRMRSLMTFELMQPDDLLCEAIIKKIFADYNLLVSDDVVGYLLRHTSRNLLDIQTNIKRLNQASLEEKRNITVPFLKTILQC